MASIYVIIDKNYFTLLVRGPEFIQAMHGGKDSLVG